jgi:hypothetical protein
MPSTTRNMNINLLTRKNYYEASITPSCCVSVARGTYFLFGLRVSTNEFSDPHQTTVWDCRNCHPCFFLDNSSPTALSCWQLTHGVPELARLHRAFLIRQFRMPHLTCGVGLSSVIATVSEVAEMRLLLEPWSIDILEVPRLQIFLWITPYSRLPRLEISAVIGCHETSS